MTQKVSWASNPRSRQVMLGNRSRDTKPELAVRRACHARGLRYRVDARPMPTLRRRADLVFPTERVAVFVDGCYWHGCPEHYVASKSNTDYWSEKIERNMKRDLDTDEALSAGGWEVVRVWQHENPDAAAEVVAVIVRARREEAREAAVPRVERPVLTDGSRDGVSGCTSFDTTSDTSRPTRQRVWRWPGTLKNRPSP